jgi:hypothetical protein
MAESEPYAVDGSITWRNSDNQLHRLDGPAITHPNGDMIWAKNGILHRENGPALDYSNGIKQWWIDGKHHRLDGPATLFPDGNNHWFINDFRVTDKITLWAKERDIDLNNLSDLDKVVIALEWGNFKE